MNRAPTETPPTFLTQLYADDALRWVNWCPKGHPHIVTCSHLKSDVPQFVSIGDKYLDVHRGVFETGVYVQLWGRNGTKAQKWFKEEGTGHIFIEDEGKRFKITSDLTLRLVR